MKIGIFYGSSTGTTAEVAEKIAKQLGVDAADVYDVAKVGPSKFGEYDMLVLGSSTYGSGELQDDWYDMLDGAEKLELKGKRIAVFGCGDESMTDTFCDAVSIIYERMKPTEATMVGMFNTYPYEFDSSKAVPVQGGEAVGLLIDEVNHSDVTDTRIEEWCKTLVG